MQNRILFTCLVLVVGSLRSYAQGCQSSYSLNGVDYAVSQIRHQCFYRLPSQQAFLSNFLNSTLPGTYDFENVSASNLSFRNIKATLINYVITNYSNSHLVNVGTVSEQFGADKVVVNYSVTFDVYTFGIKSGNNQINVAINVTGFGGAREYNINENASYSTSLESTSNTTGHQNLTVTTSGGSGLVGDLLSLVSSFMTSSFTPMANQVVSAVEAQITNSQTIFKVNENLIQESQVITFNALDGKTFGASPFSLTASSSSGLTVSFTSSDPSIVSVTGSTATIHTTGSVTITASQSGNEIYKSASVGQSLTISKSNQTITFAQPASKTYGDAAFNLSATSTSDLSVTFKSSDASVISINGSIATILKAGTVTITAMQAGNNNFNAATNVERSITVNKSDQAITFDALAAKTFGDHSFTLSSSSTSGLSVAFTSSDPSIVSVSGNTATIMKPGSVTITATQPGDNNYNAAPNVVRTLLVNKASQTITFDQISSKTFGNDSFTLSASSNSGLAVAFSSSDPQILSIEGSTATILNAGTVTITASQAGSEIYSQASVDQSVPIKKADQVISFSGIANNNEGGTPFIVSATATSGLTVSFTTSTDRIALTGNQVTIAKPGRATIVANQAGNSNYNAAPSVSQDFCIKPSRPTITLSNANTAAPHLQSSSAIGNQWYKNGTAISNATAQTLTATADGSYKVQVKVDDCVSDFSLETVVMITGLDPEFPPITVSPNPAGEYILIKGLPDGASELSILDMNGRQMQVQLQRVSDGHMLFAISDFTPGVYVAIVAGRETIQRIKFIKSRD